MGCKWVWIAGVAVGLALAAPAGAAAAPITVNTGTEHGTASQCGLQDAINAANNDAAIQGCAAGSGADTITFDPSVAMVTITAALPQISTDMSIQGPDTTTQTPALTLKATAGCSCEVISQTAGTLSISGLEITGGKGFGSAGALSTAVGTVTHLDLLTVDANSATTAVGLNICGGGITNSGAMTLTRSTVANNTATGASGGTFSAASGGGICNGGTLTADQDTFDTNHAVAAGGTNNNDAEAGGVYGFTGLTLERSTVVDNDTTATGPGTLSAGGGVLLHLNTTSTLTSDTLAGNDATVGPTLSVQSGATANVRNSIFALPGGVNTVGAVNCATADVTAVIASGGFNIDSGTSCGFTQASDQPSVLPLLNALGNNGGPTNTRSLQTGSPAIDAGNSFGETTDQRGAGFPRPSDVTTVPDGPGDKADIGAFEAAGVPVVPPPGGGGNPLPIPPKPTATGQRRAQLAKCKKKRSKRLRKKCIKRAKKLRP